MIIQITNAIKFIYLETLNFDFYFAIALIILLTYSISFSYNK